MRPSLIKSLLLLTFILILSNNLLSKEDNKKKNGWIGVSIQNLSSTDVKSFKLKSDEGVLITEIVENSPADSAGLKEDDVILSVEGRTIYDTDDLIKTIRKQQIGSKIKLEISRNGELKSISLIVGKLPRKKNQLIFEGLGDNFNVFNYAFGSGTKIGVEVTELGDQLSEYFDVKNGLLIKNVTKDSPAEKAGLKAGDIILSVDKEKVKNVSELMEILNEFEKGDKVDFEIQRKGVKKIVQIEIEKSKTRDNNFNIFMNKVHPGNMHISIPDFHFDVSDLEHKLEVMSPQLEKKICKELQIKIEKSIDAKKIKNEVKKLKPTLEKLRKEIRENVKESIEVEI